MQEIKPISDESDILREANAASTASNPPPQPVVPTNIASGPTTIAAAPPQSVSNEANVNIMPANNGYDASKIYGKDAIARLAALHPIEEKDVTKIFTYRLPRFSYILVWFYSFAVFMLSFMFFANLNYINTMKADNDSNSSYSYSYYSSTSGKEVDTKPYYELMSVVLFGVSDHGQNLKYVGIPLVICIFMLVVILSGNRILRYAGIGVCLLVIAYLLYLYIRFQIDMNALKSSYENRYTYTPDTTSTFDARAGAILMRGLSMTTFFWPYLFFPVATFIYLLTPTAREAYN